MIEQEKLIDAPFPGLRPFETSENFVFFGRDGQSDEVLAKLRSAKFVAVVGTSGSGKSSLVRAGLLPALLSGHMPSAGSNWRIAIFRPGNSPIKNLAVALNAPEVFGKTNDDQAATRLSHIERTLRRSSLGLLEVVSQIRMRKGENLLVLADQFEELFRFKQGLGDAHAQDEAAAFVKLLLEARQLGKTDEERLPIYIILTMRSDYLGDCANFWGLPEAINDGQYLIPRMTDDERREAITGPAIIGGGSISAPLVNRLLNDAGEDPARLPILQHSLMRTWDYWKSSSNNETLIDLVHYEKIGTMAGALSIHADEAFSELSPPQQKIAEKLFKALTEKESDRNVRRPATIGEIAASAEASEDDVKDVVENFRREGRSFLMPPATVELTSDTLIDISHESLIGGWERLKTWVEEEAEAAWQYRRLAQCAVLFPDEEGYLRGPALQMNLRWREKNRPTKAWAMRYDPNFEKSIDYLDQSKQTYDDEVAEKERKRQEEIQKDLKAAEAISRERLQRLRLQRWALLVLTVMLLGMVAATAYAFKQKRTADEQRDLATKALAQVTEEEGRTKAALKVARDEKARAEHTLYQLQKAETGLRAAVKEAKGQRDRAEAALKTAQVERDRAQKQTLIAQAATTEANKQTQVAQWAQENTQQALESEKKARQALVAEKQRADEQLKRAEELLGLITEIDSSAPYFRSVMRGAKKEITRATFSPDGTAVLTTEAGGIGARWNAQTGAPSEYQFATGTGNRLPSPLVMSPGGNYILQAEDSHGDAAGYIFDAKTGATLGRIQGWHPSVIDKSVFSADERWVVSFNPERQSISIVDVKTGEVLQNFGEGYFNTVQSYALSPDGKRIAAARADAFAIMWDIPTRSVVGQLRHLDEVRSVAFSRDSKFVVTTSKDGTALVWDAISGSLLTQLAGRGGTVNGAIFDPTGNYIVTTSDKNAYFWKQRVKGSWTEVSPDSPHTLKGHTDLITQALFSPDGKWVATFSRDRTAQLWDAEVLSSTYADSQAPNTINVAVFRGHIRPLTSGAFSPDSKYLVTGSEDRTARVWDLTSLGAFTISDIKVAADRPNYSGKCPATIRFIGRIIVSGRSGRLKYRFVRSDGTVTLDKELVFDTPGQRLVIDSRDVFPTLKNNGNVIPTNNGWVQLEILEPERKISDRATYTVTCTGLTQLTEAALTSSQLKQIMPTASNENIARYLPFIRQAMDDFGINTPLSRAAFLAEVAVLTADLKVMEEVGSDEALEKLYGQRKDLGNIEPGDGAHYKGRGAFQIAGRAYYRALGELLGVDLVAQPQLVATPELAFRTAALYWYKNGLNERAEREDIVGIHRRISLQGSQTIKDVYDRARTVLGGIPIK